MVRMVSPAMTLLDSTTKFKHFSSIGDTKCGWARKYLKETEEISILLDPILRVIVSSQITVDKILVEELNGLNLSINEVKELMGSWSRTSSTIYSVLEVESILAKVQSFVLQICRKLGPLFQSREMFSAHDYVEQCMKKIGPKCYEETSDIVNTAIAHLVKNGVTVYEHLMKIVDSVGLSTNIELLMELAALNMLKRKVVHDEDPREANYIEHITVLVSDMLKSYIEKHLVRNINGAQVPIDIYCPLSLEIMSDPVIVASGQTYERAFIQKWLDLGFTLCPKTWQTIRSTSLIPNYTVKALIASWCDMNGVKCPENAILSRNQSTEFLVQEDCNANISDSSRSLPSESDLAELKSNGLTFLSNGFHQGHLEEESMVFTAPMPSSLTNASTSLSNNGDLSQENDGEVQYPALLASTLPADPLQSGDSNATSGSNASTGEITPWQICLPSPSTPRSRSGTSSPTSLQGKYTLSETEIAVNELIRDLESSSINVQAAGIRELRLMTKTSTENRIVIVDCGAVKHIIRLLHSPDVAVQENAVTTLLNLSLNHNNKMAIANSGVIGPLIHVLMTGSQEARGNAAATLYSLSIIDENKPKIGHSEAIRPLVELLSSGTPHARKDAATALFSLSLHHENKVRIVQAGAVKPLVDLMDPSYGIVDKSVAILANLSSTPEGRDAIGHGGGIPALVEVIELGSMRGKENAAAALLHLCMDNDHGGKYCSMALQADAVPPVKVLRNIGTPRAKEKAHSLLCYFKNHRQRRARKH